MAFGLLIVSEKFMEVTFWGTRGSVPVAETSTSHYGGNTSCIEILTAAGDLIIIDAGTGLPLLGNKIVNRHNKSCTILFTHAHWDHIHGLPFFSPMHSSDWDITFCADKKVGKKGIHSVLQGIFNGRNFPKKLDSLTGNLHIKEFEEGESFELVGAEIETCATHHPGGNTAYKITADGFTVLITGDHEWCEDYNCPKCKELTSFMKGADIIIADGQYTKVNYAKHKGWGHSYKEDWPTRVVAANIKKLIITHHNPLDSDLKLQEDLSNLREQYADLPVEIFLAREAMRISPLGNIKYVPSREERSYCWLCDFTKDLGKLLDTGMILDSILKKARKLCNAEAGTVYLVEDEKLIFAYTQNEKLFGESSVNKAVYLTSTLPIDTSSIAGYVATFQKQLKLDDMYNLPSKVPYSFNSSFDESSGYKTVSTLTAPFVHRNGKLLGVLQLINRLDENYEPIAFSVEDQEFITSLSYTTASILETSVMAKELILRMLKMSALRDPKETASHVKRVGAIAAEIYHAWALTAGIDPQELRESKSNLFLAAMLHDVGKVGISDTILKKPGRLNPEERAIMEEHCAYGAGLFIGDEWKIGQLAHDIALHHHQKWNGTGYTGDPNVPPLSGEDIPLTARIVAVADVFDALTSPRVYKEPWPMQKSIDIIKQDSGSHFDPAVVDAFLSIIDTVIAIRVRYEDEVEE